MITANYYTYSADEDLLKSLVYQYGAVIAAVQVKTIVILYHIIYHLYLMISISITKK